MNKGWTEERRARQAVLIHAWKLWSQSTGPRTRHGKDKSKNNAYKHRERSGLRTSFLRLISNYLNYKIK